MLMFLVLFQFRRTICDVWLQCAAEGQMCEVAANGVVRFGSVAAGLFSYHNVTAPGILCARSSFAFQDAAPNHAKTCSVDKLLLKREKPVVYNTFCTAADDSIGVWFNKNMLPFVFASYCPQFAPIWKTCDFPTRRRDVYAKLFKAVVKQAMIDAPPADSLRMELTLDYNKPLRAQFEALQCADYARASAVLIKKPLPELRPTAEFQFNDRFKFKPFPEQLKLSLPGELKLLKFVFF
jgi:hypothetical protein